MEDIEPNDDTLMEEIENPEPSTSKRVRLQKHKTILPSNSNWSSNKLHV